MIHNLRYLSIRLLPAMTTIGRGLLTFLVYRERWPRPGSPRSGIRKRFTRKQQRSPDMQMAKLHVGTSPITCGIRSKRVAPFLAGNPDDIIDRHLLRSSAALPRHGQFCQVGALTCWAGWRNKRSNAWRTIQRWAHRGTGRRGLRSIIWFSRALRGHPRILANGTYIVAG